MDSATFDLTAPPQISQKIQPQKTPEVVIPQTKKQETVPKPQRLPQLNATRGQKQMQSQSSKSLQKPNKIEVFREAIDRAITIQPSQSKKEKKNKPSRREIMENQLKAIEEAYEQRVVNRYNDLYKGNQVNVNDELKQLEKRDKIQKELHRQEESLNKENLEHDKLLYSVKQKVGKVKNLDVIIADLEEQQEIASDNEDIEIKFEKEEIQKERLRQLEHEIAILKGMHTSRKKLLFQVQKQCTECYDDLKQCHQKIDIYSTTISTRQKQLESLTSIVKKFREDDRKEQHLFGATLKQRFDPMLEEILEEELSKFEDMAALKEIIQHEKEIKLEKLKEEKQQKILQQYRDQQDQDKATQLTRQNRQEINTLLENKEQMFDKLRRVISIEQSEKIIPYKLELDIGIKELKDIQIFVQQENERYIQENDQLQQSIKVLKYEDDIADVEKQINIDKIERELVKEYDVLSDKEKSVKKVEKTIDEINMALSRIMYQLQGKGTKSKNVEIPRKNLVATASQIQLRLERMLTVLSKTQEFLNEESVNTNPKYEIVPEFIGLNAKRYAEVEIQDFIGSERMIFKEEESQDQDDDDEIERERLLLKLKLEEKTQQNLIAKQQKEKDRKRQ